jgi:hypothetical protein
VALAESGPFKRRRSRPVVILINWSAPGPDSKQMATEKRHQWPSLRLKPRPDFKAEASPESTTPKISQKGGKRGQQHLQTVKLLVKLPRLYSNQQPFGLSDPLCQY